MLDFVDWVARRCGGQGPTVESCNGADDNCDCNVDELKSAQFPNGIPPATPAQVCGVTTGVTDPNCTTNVTVSCTNGSISGVMVSHAGGMRFGGTFTMPASARTAAASSARVGVAKSVRRSAASPAERIR